MIVNRRNRLVISSQVSKGSCAVNEAPSVHEAAVYLSLHGTYTLRRQDISTTKATPWWRGIQVVADHDANAPDEAQPRGCVHGDSPWESWSSFQGRPRIAHSHIEHRHVVKSRGRESSRVSSSANLIRRQPGRRPSLTETGGVIPDHTRARLGCQIHFMPDSYTDFLIRAHVCIFNLQICCVTK